MRKCSKVSSQNFDSGNNELRLKRIYVKYSGNQVELEGKALHAVQYGKYEVVVCTALGGAPNLGRDTTDLRL